jgi:phosphatidate cytidylyltransferase
MPNPLSSLSNLQQRVIVGVLGIGFFLGMLWLGWEAALLLFGSILVLSLWEFYGLFPGSFPRIWKTWGTMLGLLLFILLVLSSIQPDTRPSVLVFVFPPLLLIPLVFSDLAKPFEMLSWLVLGWFYLVTPWISMWLMVLDFNYHPGLMLGLFGLLWAADSGAYFVGRKFGKTKLLPRVSPKKSWEGLFGGMAFSMALAYILHETLPPTFTLNQWLMLAVSTTVFGTLGDLAESALKRSLDLKDSGNLLPGHGGILDRFDGLFVAAPANLILVQLFF